MRRRLVLRFLGSIAAFMPVVSTAYACPLGQRRRFGARVVRNANDLNAASPTDVTFFFVKNRVGGDGISAKPLLVNGSENGGPVSPNASLSVPRRYFWTPNGYVYETLTFEIFDLEHHSIGDFAIVGPQSSTEVTTKYRQEGDLVEVYYKVGSRDIKFGQMPRSQWDQT